MKVDWVSIEDKWRKRWQQENDFEADPDESMKKKFVTVAYPYPNSPQHIGHGRTYTIADVHSRFYRMKGYNVLFPMGFHYTGTPILGMAKRIENGDKELIEALENLYHVPSDKIREFVDPVKIADYFHEEIKAGMIEMGYSIDWRREFTTIDPGYQKFITWQVNTLKDKGLIIQGSHPVGWCPNDNNPVSQHDTLGDVEPDFTEYILIKFQFGDYTIPTATLRPETIFGVTNLWVNPDTTYKKIRVNGEKWIVSNECAYKLQFQDNEVSFEGQISGKELIGKSAKSPYDSRDVFFLPAPFVKSDTGTGMVMSVPAHAPFDYQALEDLKKDYLESSELLAQIEDIRPISIIKTEGYGEVPAKEVIDELEITTQKDDKKLEEATKHLYSKEFYGGILKENTERFSGRKVSDVKDEIKDWFLEKNYAGVFLELNNPPIRCRCGAECVVKILNNQWFLNYGDSDWKDNAIRCLEQMNILPSEIRSEFKYVIGWLKERACARQQGLGTKLPWDNNWIVESLADSVIYMAYYILAKFVNSKDIPTENLNDEFFDYVLLGKGNKEQVSESTEIDVEKPERVKKEFAYFYPVDSRHSGRDLVPNHLTFFILNHVAIFPQEIWPQEIVVNGSVLMEGKKMSKSMGNIIPLREAVRRFGADPIRLAIIISAELLQDADFNLESVEGIKNKLESMLDECKKYKKDSDSDTLEPEDRWMETKIQKLVADVTESIEKMRLREALHNILFGFESELQWYLKRKDAKNARESQSVLNHLYTTRIAMLSPFAPHIAEEMWEKIGQKEMVSKDQWPMVQKEKIDYKAIQSEELLKKVLEDISKILKVTKISPKKITIYTADRIKFKAYKVILSKINEGQTNLGAIMKALIGNKETEQIKKNPDFVRKTIDDILSEPVELRNSKENIEEFNEEEFLHKELSSMIKKEYQVNLEVFEESDSERYDPKNKARTARPYKPAILIE